MFGIEFVLQLFVNSIVLFADPFLKSVPLTVFAKACSKTVLEVVQVPFPVVALGNALE